MENSIDINSLWAEVKTDVIERLEAIAEAIEGKIAHRISNYQPYPIYDTGEFLNKLQHQVSDMGDDILVQIWSDTPHTKYILGGRPPHHVPLKTLVAWVERKKLSWVDKSGKKLTALQMAYLVQTKIKRVGIKERNVFREVLEEEMAWIESQINKIGDKI